VLQHYIMNRYPVKYTIGTTKHSVTGFVTQVAKCFATDVDVVSGLRFS
jgi:hypothetical protein